MNSQNPSPSLPPDDERPHDSMGDGSQDDLSRKTHITRSGDLGSANSGERDEQNENENESEEEHDRSLSSIVGSGPISQLEADSQTIEKIGRYRVIRLLGEGGFGGVYLAEDDTLRRHVAIKLPRVGKGSKKLDHEFLKEARQLAQLNHVGIVSVFDLGYEEGRCFIVSDYLSGPSLSQWLKKNKPDWRTSAQICMKIAEALAHAHAHRTIHRDLKPANVILTEEMQPVIVDFGLAVSDEQRADGTLRGEISGTPSFMSPEQASGAGHRIDGRTDIYSLGAILYRMVTGRNAFKSRSMTELLRQVVEDEPQPPRQIARHIPRELEEICLRAMEKSLRDRYTTADDMVDDLRRLLSEEAVEGQSISATADTFVVAEDSGERTFITEMPPDSATPPGTEQPELHASTDQSLLTVNDAHSIEPPDSRSFSNPAVNDDSESTSPQRTTSIRRQQSQRRQVTMINCACDVFENEDILESLDPEEQVALLNEFQEFCSGIAAEFQGTVLQTTEDGVSICFGFPIAFEDAARRAVRFGLAVRDRLDRVNIRWKQQDVALSVRVALHTDSAIAEANFDDSDQSSHVSIVGGIRNISTRLTDLADPGSVIVSQQTWLLCRDLFDFEVMGEQKVRGLPGKVELYEVVSEHSRDSGFDGTGEQSLTPLVGRDRETGLLQERWEQATEGMGQVVLIIGEAGLGKSRLVHSLKRHVTKHSADSAFSPIAEWRASSQRSNSSLFPVVDYFERRLSFGYEESDGGRLKKLVEHLAELELDDAEAVALFAGMLSIPLKGRYPELDLAPQPRKEKLLLLLLDWLRELSYRQPLLFIIEDLHWVDPSTLEFLELLVDQGLNDRILTLFTFRPEFETPWGSKAHQTNLALNRLTRRQVQELMESRSKRAFPEAVVDQVVDRTDGVPLFVEEFTKLLIESNSVAAGDSSISTMQTLQQIPASLQDMLMSRLDRIEGDIETMQLGAAIGREFSLKLIRVASPLPDDELEQELEKLVEAEILFTQGRGSRLRYSFKHALIQDAAYNSLIRQRRQQLHLNIAQSMEESFPETCHKEPEVVARHFSEAGDDEKAFTYWNRAAERSLQSYAYREAIEQIRGALDALRALPETRDNKFREIELHISLGVPLQSLEGYSAPSVEDNYARAYQLCQEVQLPMQFIPVLYGLFRFYMLKARHDKARELGKQLVDLAAQAGEDDYFLFAHRALAGPMIYQAEYAAALPHLDKALAIPATQKLRVRGRRYDVVDPWVAAGSYKSWALWMTGFATQAFDESRRAVLAAESLNHPFSLTLAVSFSSWLHQFSGDTEATYETAKRAQVIAEEQGYLFWVGWHRVMISWARGIGKRRDESAIAEIRTGMTEWRAQGSELGGAYFSELLADVALAHGHLDEAHDALDEADKLSISTGEVFSRPQYFCLRGKLALKEKDPELAEHHYRSAVEVSEQQVSKIYHLRAITRLCQLLQSTDRTDEALSLLATTRSWFTEGFESRDLKRADKLLNELRNS